MGEHPSNAMARAVFGMPPADKYREWVIGFDYGWWNATGPDYDASWEGEEEGWIDNGHHVTARTRPDLIDEIDAWFEESK